MRLGSLLSKHISRQLDVNVRPSEDVLDEQIIVVNKGHVH